MRCIRLKCGYLLHLTDKTSVSHLENPEGNTLGVLQDYIENTHGADFRARLKVVRAQIGQSLIKAESKSQASTGHERIMNGGRKQAH
jgi:hypothetical protein